MEYSINDFENSTFNNLVGPALDNRTYAEMYVEALGQWDTSVQRRKLNAPLP